MHDPGDDEAEPRRGWDAPRLLLAAGVLVAVIAFATWNLGAHHGSTGSGTPGTCQVPTSATSGTEPPPAFVSRLVNPLGRPSATFTKTEDDSTVYGLCYDIVSGSQVTAVMDLLSGHGYASEPGQNVHTQLNYTAAHRHPYGVSLTVTGDIEFGTPAAAAKGGLSVVWTDADPDG